MRIDRVVDSKTEDFHLGVYVALFMGTIAHHLFRVQCFIEYVFAM